MLEAVRGIKSTTTIFGPLFPPLYGIYLVEQFEPLYSIPSDDMNVWRPSDHWRLARDKTCFTGLDVSLNGSKIHSTMSQKE